MLDEARNEEGLTVQEKLDRLYGLRKERESIVYETEAEINALRDKIEAMTNVIQGEIDKLADEISEECMNLGESIKGTYLQVIYSKGREMFDNARLKTMLPNVYRDFLTTGKPSVRIAENKTKEK